MLHVYPLMAQELDAGTSIPPAAPVPPQQRSRSDREGMQKHTHLTRLGCHFALPLALLAQRARAATADAGGVHDAQASIGFPAPFVRRQLLPGGTAQCAIGLEGKVATREAIGFPGRSDFRWSISLCRGSRVESLSLLSQVSRSKLGGAHRIGVQVMAQFQTEVPEPLADELPALLSPGGMTTPPNRVLLAILIGECIFKRATMQIECYYISSGEGILWEHRQEQLVDDPITLDAHSRLFRSCRMRRHHHTTALPVRAHRHERAIIERSYKSTFWTAELLVGGKGEPKLDLSP